MAARRRDLLNWRWQRALAPRCPALERKRAPPCSHAPSPGPASRCPSSASAPGRPSTSAPAGAELAPRKEVLRTLFEAGGRVIDSSPMYGRAEEVVGVLLTDMQALDKPFLATKVWTSGEAAGIAADERLRRQDAGADRPHAGAQPRRLAHAPADAARLEGAEEGALHRHHPLHRAGARRAGGRHPRRAGHRLRAVRLLDQRARRRGAPAAAVRRARHRRRSSTSRSTAASSSARCAARRCPSGRRRSTAPAGGRCSSSTSWATPPSPASSPAPPSPSTCATTSPRASGRLPDAAERKRMAELWDGL